DLLVEVASRKQAQQILKLNSLSTIPISVQPHITLNSSKGLITCGRLLNLSNEEITQELDGQGVKDVRRINIRRDARRLVKAQTPPDGKSYASVVDKSHPVYQTTNCPHCNHLVTMSNPVPSTSKSPEPVAIASSSGTTNKNILPKPSSQTSAVSQDSSGFTIKKLKIKILKNKTDKNKISTDKTANSTSESSEGNSSDTDSDITVTSAPEESNTQKNRARSKSEKSQKLKQAKRLLSQKDLPAKLKKSAHHNSVALGLADKGIAHKDLPSIFGGVPQVLDLKLHPSDEDEDLQMNCDASETPPCVPTSNPRTFF
ncbi:hypothetical protein AVEN_181468-1, partial [Araneus ventricosus]